MGAIVAAVKVSSARGKGSPLAIARKGDQWQHPTSAYFLGDKESQGNELRCKRLHFKL